MALLGPPGLVHGDDRLTLSGRQPALLAALALAAPRPVPRERLVDLLWGDELPTDPANALHQRISALRKALASGRPEAVLATSGGGYALQVDDEAIDARRFARLAGHGTRLLAAGDAEGAVIELRAALSLWYGDPLEGVADEPWARADAIRLDELRLTATEDLNDAALATGAGTELVGDLTDLHTRHPLRERPAGQLMLALCRAERQADALEVYDRTRRRLADELGVDPGPALQHVYRLVLDQAGTTAPAIRAGHATTPEPTAAGGSTSTRGDNLPAPTTEVLGRDEELVTLGSLLTRGRCLTLTGPGGTGKTTLAVELARRLPVPPHGTWLVELASLSGAAAVAQRTAEVLGLGATGLGAGDLGVEVLATALRDRHLLLVIDNAEHVLASVRTLTTTLLAASPGLRLVVTSREPLGIPGEQVVPVAPLEVPAADEEDPTAIAGTAAVRLLQERARQRDPWFEVGADDLTTAATVVRQLDGIPLAIELAAAQLRVRSIRELAASLDDRLSLASPVRTGPPRQHTLRDTLDWSWDLLDEDQQRAWAALSTGAGALDLDAAARLLTAAGIASPPVEVVGDLVDRSLLTVERHADATRYRQLSTLRSYGREQAARLGLAGPLTEAHAELVEERLERAFGAVGDPARFTVDLAALAGWLADARLVLARADAAGDRTRLQRIAGRLGWIWLLRGLASEGIDWLDRGLGDLAEVDPASADPAAILWASGLRLGRAHDDGAGWAALAVAAPQPPADRVLALVYAAVHAVHAGALDDSTRHLELARAAADAIGGWPLGFTHLVSAQLGRLTGRLADRVRDDAEAALALLTDEGLAWAQGLAFDILVDVVLDLDGKAGAERAGELAAEGLRRCAGRGLPELESRLRLQLARALHRLGDVAAARRHAEAGVRLAERVGQPVALGFALLIAGGLARLRGELDEALGQLRRAKELLTGSGAPFGAVEANVELGLAYLTAGDLAAATAASTTALGVATEAGEPVLLDRAQELVAAVRAAGGSPDLDGGARGVDAPV